ncbi:MAG: type II toxin-antitoxin system VapC family toxin [Granulosicoccus sp.]
MILADTSIWIRHLSTPDHPLTTELMKNNISIHSIVIGELACGSLSHRKAILADLNDLPHVIGVQHTDVMQFVEHLKLYSRGVGYSDFHLLAATKLGQAHALWTADRRLNQLAIELGVAYQP